MDHPHFATILILTHDPAIQFWMKKHLVPAFFVLFAENEEEALASAQNTILDFTIVDAEMSHPEILDTCKKLHQILKNATPILLMTGSLKKQFLDAAKKSGVSAFLIRPPDFEDLQNQFEILRKANSLQDKANRIINPRSDE